ncbi:HAD-IB family phosphatase [Pyrococcus kukulkanii]|uniref:phosphoserine phosphatase n=1 Tax=Pyrococcus kukulkanii TaxID=1609559 RepID=A0A127BCB7_9EURY|nr:HAD-IB family phosphatase [Pyrococcus kukulkanii]AMM54306.1 phosphoserine phosphatase [Pyrococcus kukulkanii]
MKLIAFDLEGTLTDMISWELLHKKFKTCDKAKEHMELFFSGKINYYEWARLDASLWKGRSRKEVEEAFREITLKDYAQELLSWLKRNDFKTAIISGGLMCLAKRVAEILGVDYVFANELVFDKEGRIMGDVIVRVTFNNKGEILRSLKEKLKPELTIAVGDWENDIPMFREADISISLKGDGATYRVRDLREVKDIIEKILRGRKG